MGVGRSGEKKPYDVVSVYTCNNVLPFPRPRFYIPGTLLEQASRYSILFLSPQPVGVDSLL